MTEVARPAGGHPGPMTRERRDSQDSVDRELDWLIQRAEAVSLLVLFNDTSSESGNLVSYI